MSLERRFAIIVGTNCYSSEEHQLKYSLKDADDIRNILQAHCEFKSENITIIKADVNSNQSIANEIFNAFKTIKDSGFIKGMHTILFYYSGHGIYNMDDAKSYLELSDNEQIAIQDIFYSIKNLSAKNSYIIIDACHSGGQLNLDDYIKGNKQSRQFHYNSEGIYCLFSSTHLQKSYEPNVLQSHKYKIHNGFLTHYLIEIINSYEKYTEGFLGFGSIQEYIKIKSQLLSNFKQIPVSQTSNTEGVHPFAILKAELSDYKNFKEVSLNVQECLTILENASFDLIKEKNYFGDYEDSHIERAQTKSLVDWIENDLQTDKKNIAILVGNAGLGKTIVLKDLYETLNTKDIPTLAIKANNYRADKLSDLEEKIFQKNISITEVFNPLLSKNKKIVVIVDQIDALSLTLSAKRDFIITYNRLINQLTGNRNIRIIISIRKYDLEYDAELNLYKQNEYTQFELLPLESEKVKQFLNKIGIYNTSNKLIELLRIPNNLNVFCKLENKEKNNIDNLSSLKDLYDALWNEMIAKAQNSSEYTLDIRGLLFDVAKRMDEIGTSVPNSFNVKYLRELDFLKSKSIVVQSKNILTFFHQTFYDYVFSKQFVENDYVLTNFIIHNNQSLYVRGIVKMVLDYLREYDPTKYIDTVKQILIEPKYRFHIKSLAISNMGLMTNLFNTEKKFVNDYILTNEKHAELFINSIVSDEWLQFLIEKKIINDYLKKTVDEVERNSKHNLIWRLLRNNINQNLDLVLNCFDSFPDFPEKANFIGRLLYFVQKWENIRLLGYFEKYIFPQNENVRDNFSFYQDLKKIAVFHKDYAFEKVRPSLVNTFSADAYSSVSLQHEEKELLNEIYKLHPDDTFSFLFVLMKEIVDIQKFESSNGKINSPLYVGNHFSDRGIRSHLDRNGDCFIFEIISKHLKLIASQNKERFIEFYNNNKNTNSIPVLKLLIVSLTTINTYSEQFIEIIDIVNLKNGFRGYDNRFSLYLRNLIVENYTILNQTDKDKIINILLNMRSIEDYYIYEKDDKKRVYLGNFFKKQYMYIKALPMSEIQSNLLLKKRYQELERKFGEIDVELLSESRMVFGGVPAPLKANAYKKMKFSEWENSMLKYNSAYQVERSFGDFKGGIEEHSRAFEEEVNTDVNKYGSFVRKIIVEIRVSPTYMVAGLRGLQEGQYDVIEFLNLFKILIKYNLDKSFAIYFVWMTEYLIKNKVIDIDVVKYLSDLALNHENPSKPINEHDPDFDSLNTVRGAAIQKLILCFYNQEFSDVIFETVEKAANDKQPSVKVGILRTLAYLNNIDVERSFQIFLKLVDSNDEKVIQSSLWSGSYFSQKYFSKMKKYFNKLINIQSTHSDCSKILFYLWYKGNKKANDFLELLISKSKTAKMSILHEAEDHFFDGEGLNSKAMFFFYKFLDDEIDELAHAYSGLILRKFQLEHFEIVLPFLLNYSKSKQCSLDKSSLLQYLITCAKKYPKECLELIESLDFNETPDIRKSNYYHNEPLLAILGIYSSLINNNMDMELIERALNIFDNMLQNEYFSLQANEALETLK